MKKPLVIRVLERNRSREAWRAHLNLWCKLLSRIISSSSGLKYIYWFALFGMASPSVRYRGKYMLEELKSSEGINYSFVYPGYQFKEIFLFIQTWFSALFFRKKDSIIVIQRVYTSGIYATALKLLTIVRRARTIYDIDDAEYVMHSPRTVHFFMKHCSACFAGSHALADYCRKFNSRVFLMTSPVTDHGIRKKRKNEILTIGWIGCFWGTQKESFSEVFLPALLEVRFPVKLIILGVKNRGELNDVMRSLAANSNIEIDIPENMNWMDENMIYLKVEEFDIGISPLTDTEINRAKSAYKLKQCFSCGIPVLGSPVGENKTFLRHGVNGFICNSSREFLENLINVKSISGEEYRRLCENALDSRHLFSMRSYCDHLINLYDYLC